MVTRPLCGVATRLFIYFTIWFGIYAATLILTVIVADRRGQVAGCLFATLGAVAMGIFIFSPCVALVRATMQFRSGKEAVTMIHFFVLFLFVIMCTAFGIPLSVFSSRLADAETTLSFKIGNLSCDFPYNSSHDVFGVTEGDFIRLAPDALGEWVIEYPYLWKQKIDVKTVYNDDGTLKGYDLFCLVPLWYADHRTPTLSICSTIQVFAACEYRSPRRLASCPLDVLESHCNLHRHPREVTMKYIPPEHPDWATVFLRAIGEDAPSKKHVMLIFSTEGKDKAEVEGPEARSQRNGTFLAACFVYGVIVFTLALGTAHRR